MRKGGPTALSTYANHMQPRSKPLGKAKNAGRGQKGRNGKMNQSHTSDSLLIPQTAEIDFNSNMRGNNQIKNISTLSNTSNMDGPDLYSNVSTITKTAPDINMENNNPFDV